MALFQVKALGQELVRTDEALKQGNMVIEESVVPGVLFEEGADILTSDGNIAFDFAGAGFRGEEVFLPGSGGHLGVEPMLECIPVTDLGATGATYSGRHETSFSNEFRTGRRLRTHVDPIPPAGSSPVYHRNS